MTFGMDVGWRRRAIRELHLPPGSRVFDLACGTGDLCRELRRAGHRPIGFDFAFGMLANARTDAPLVQADALRLPVPDGPPTASRAGSRCATSCRSRDCSPSSVGSSGPGGAIALLDASRPEQPVLRAGHAVYFEQVVPLIGGLLSDRDAYAYLPRSMAYLPPPEEMLAMLRGAGFPSARRLAAFGWDHAAVDRGTRVTPGRP